MRTERISRLSLSTLACIVLALAATASGWASGTPDKSDLGYGGWRNTYSIIPPVGTSRPGSLADAVAQGTQRTLSPGESARTSVIFHCLTGVDDEEEVRARLRENQGVCDG